MKINRTITIDHVFKPNLERLLTWKEGYHKIHKLKIMNNYLQGQGNRQGAADSYPELRWSEQGRDWEHGERGGGQRRGWQNQQGARRGHQPGRGNNFVLSLVDGPLAYRLCIQRSREELEKSLKTSQVLNLKMK